MKKTFIRNKKIIIVFLLLFIPLTFLNVYRIDYSLTAPGFNDDISDFIIIEDSYYTGNTFHTTSVISIKGITPIQYLFGMYSKTVSISEFPDYYDDIDINDLTIMSYLMKDDSIATSLVVGIENSDKDITYSSYLTVYLIFNTLTPNSLELGDKILTINGNTDLDLALSNIECGELVDFKVIRDDDELVVKAVKNDDGDGTCSFGMYLDHFTKVIDTNAVYTIIDNNTGGPSGGLMQALYIYYGLMGSDLDTGMKIAGTGTIDVEGDVGYIGGVEQKIITAAMNDIDIFFIPHLSDEDNDNYIKALKVYNTLDTNMELVGVSSFFEAVEYLNNYLRSDHND